MEKWDPLEGLLEVFPEMMADFLHPPAAVHWNMKFVSFIINDIPKVYHGAL